MVKNDIALQTFLTLRKHFFDKNGKPVPFYLRLKKTAQDDPFDEYLTNVVFPKISGITCKKAPGPLITPDFVLQRGDNPTGDLCLDTSKIIAIENKKVERTKSGKVARAAGIDYNSTPPCGLIRVHTENHYLDIRGFYLFTCIEETAKPYETKVTALALVDGYALNTDFDLYLKITGEREKQINIGSYVDGCDRQRPMLIFANPLGSTYFDYNCSLIHSGKLVNEELGLAYSMRRELPSGLKNIFGCYQTLHDLGTDWKTKILVEPFPKPEREKKTRPRGKFKL